jgi:hypothetical protein
LTNSPTFHETPQPSQGIAGCILNGLVASRTESDSFEAWIGTLTKLAEKHERETPAGQDTGVGMPSRELKLPLQKLAAGPWRSLGGYFDYSHWPDRERFLELDKAIAASQELREPDLDRSIEMV